MNVECGNVIIELEPELSPNAVKRFKHLIEKGSYNHSAFYKVVKNTLIQAGDLEYGNIDNINYYKVGSGQSGLGTLRSELNKNFQFDEGSVAFARSDEFDTEDSEFFITLKKIPLYVGEYTPIGKVIYGSDGPQFPGYTKSHLDRFLTAMKDTGYTAEEIELLLQTNFEILFKLQ